MPMPPGVVAVGKQCHCDFMTNKAPAAGWIVQVTIPAPVPPPDVTRWIGPVVLSAPSFQYFNVAIAAPGNAIDAATKHLAGAEPKHGEVRAVRGLTAGEIDALKLAAGEVRPA